MIAADSIQAQRTYLSMTGRTYYVQEIVGSKVTYCAVGSTARMEASLRRFASMLKQEIPNQ